MYANLKKKRKRKKEKKLPLRNTVPGKKCPSGQNSDEKFPGPQELREAHQSVTFAGEVKPFGFRSISV